MRQIRSDQSKGVSLATSTIMASTFSSTNPEGVKLSPWPMQVDDRADLHPSTPPRRTPQPEQPSSAFPREVIEALGKPLQRIILPDDDDDFMQENLGHVWIAVHEALSWELKRKRKRKLVEMEEFLGNVKRNGEDGFFKLLRRMAIDRSWGDLLENGTLFFLFDLESP